MTGLGTHWWRQQLRGAVLRGVTAALLACIAASASAEDVSSPAILQWFEASYKTMERRSADMFLAGYGSAYTPPPGRADISNFSVGYDVYDRFDLGKAGNPTLYGTETGLKQFADVLHRFDGRLHIDAVLNHNAYSENDYVNPQFNQFLQAGGYPGFVLQNPDGGTDPAGVPGTYGDFHQPSGGVLNGQLADLLDIDHGQNHQLIRQPVAPGNPQNIPAGATPWVGRIANVPDPNNARFYQDRDLPGQTYFDPVLNQNFTFYPYNDANPLAGDAVAENATGLLMRHLRWMVEEIGVDGFRLDAAKHMEHWALQFFDAAVYRSNPRPLLDGSVEHVFMYGEVVGGDGQDPGQSLQDFLYEYVRKDIDPNQPNQIGGNRDVLDFALRQELNNNLTNNEFLQNDWRNVVNSSMDVRDDGFHNGSGGVAFVSNHDGGGAYMNNVAHAYVLTQPGNAIVYYNADQFDDPNRGFPVGGRGDALGNHGDAITELVNIRNTHGRGDYRERWLEKDYFAMERGGSMLVALANHNGAGVSSAITMDTDFAPDTRLVELTGNAAAYNATNPAQPLQQVLTVDASQQVSVRFLHNDNQDRGYLIYGLQTPQSAAGLVVTNANGLIQGGNPTTTFEHATQRLADLPIVTANQINVRLDTQAVTLPDGFRDVNADGDNAVIRVNDGMDTNGSGQIDYATPGSVVYGFEEFTDGNRSPGYGSPTGNGWYQESIDATNLPEGYNFITVRAFRKGVGGPAVFQDFKQVVYLDRFAPDAEIVSLEPWNQANPNQRDLILRSEDMTANSMHVFLDLPANLTDAEILAMVGGSSQAGEHDRDLFKRGFATTQYVASLQGQNRNFNGLTRGNHVVTVITFEESGNKSIERFSGQFTPTNIGLGFGDMNSSGTYTGSDIRETLPNNGSVEHILYSQNALFNPAFDVNGDGLNDNHDLFLLDTHLIANGASQAVLDTYTNLLLKRGDFDSSGTTDGADIAALYSGFGSSGWLLDLNVDGTVDALDMGTMVTEIFRTAPGDFNLDGVVDSADYVIVRKLMGSSGQTFVTGDADFDGDVDDDDFATFKKKFGFARQPLLAGGNGSVAGNVPEPASGLMVALALGLFAIMGRFRDRK